MQKLLEMKLLENFINLFYPKICVHCETHLLQDEDILCTNCRFDLPFTHSTEIIKNDVYNSFNGKIPIESAFSLLYFRKESITKSLIHDLKYKDNQDVGKFLAYLTFARIKAFEVYKSIDAIIPVPLHPKKERKRGYNQLTLFGKTLASLLYTSYNTAILRRGLQTKTQTLKSRFERFTSNQSKFYIDDFSTLENKHVLLIDDVITTGATLEACAHELLKIKNIRISVLTMAYTE